MLPLVYALGWIGTVLYLVNYAYMALVPGFRRERYFIANAVAGTLLSVSSVALGTWQAVLINGFWVAISLLALRGVDLRVGFLNPRLLRVLLAAMLCMALLSWVFDADLAIQVLAWSSVCAFCGSYLLFSARTLGSDEFHLMNAYAAGAILPALLADANWPVLALEACWLLLSVIAFVRQVKKGLGLPAEVETPGVNGGSE